MKLHKNLLLIANIVKGAVLPLRQFLATENRRRLKKNTFYFIFKALVVIKMFKFLSWLFGHIEKMVWLKEKINFKINNVPTWLTNNYNITITKTNNYDQCSSHIETNQLVCSANQLTGFYMRGTLVVKGLIEYKQRNIFLQNSWRKWGKEILVELCKSFLKWSWSIS